MQRSGQIGILDRLISVASYLTLGTIGMIWLIVKTLVLKDGMSQYLMCNLIQSILISIIYAIFDLAYGIAIEILMNIPLIGFLFSRFHIYVFETPIFHTMSLANYLVMLFIIYLAVVSFFGKLPYIPFVTDIAKRFYR